MRVNLRKYPAIMLITALAGLVAGSLSQPAQAQTSMQSAVESQAAVPTPVLDYNVLETFDGTRSVSLDDNLAAVAQLDSGTIVSRFRTTSAAAAKALFSASNTSLASANLSLTINAGNVHFENRTTSPAFLTNLDWPIKYDRVGRLNDGQWHTAVTSVGAQGTKIYIDGYQVHAGTSKAFFNDVPNLNSIKLGANVDSTGAEWRFVGDIERTRVFSTVLTDTEIRDLYPAPDTTTKWTPDLTYSTATALTNKMSVSANYNLATQGTISAYFNTSSTSDQAIISLSNTTQPDSRLTLGLRNGNLVYTLRNNGVDTVNFAVPGHWNDGAWHAVALRVDAAGTELFADGSLVERHSSAAFAASLSGLDGLWLGGTKGSGGESMKFNGQIGRVKLFTAGLTESSIKYLAGVAPMPTQALFDKNYAGSANYRIPSLIKTSAGTLIAGADQRKSSGFDSPNDINFTIRRSTDGGVSWGNAQVLLDFPGVGANGASVIDSVLVQNEATGRIFAMIDFFPGGGGQANALVGTGHDAQGRKILTDTTGAKFALQSNGTVVTAAGAATSYTVAANGDVSRNGSPAGNIHLKPGVDPNESLSETRTAYMLVIHSDDDGATWSQPRDITTSVKAEWMRFIGTGPGNGIQLTTGANAGRLLFPIYYNNAASPANVYSSAVIYTDDNGATWKRGASPNDGRVINGQTLSSQTVNSTSQATHEATVVERANGDVLMLMRNLAPGQLVLKSVSTDGGATWGEVVQDAKLPEIFSQPNAQRWSGAADGKDRILFANATKKFTAQNGLISRGKGVIRMSEDGGETWRYNKTFRSDNYVYNNLLQLNSSTIGLLWEMEWDGLYFTQVPVTWLTSSGS